MLWKSHSLGIWKDTNNREQRRSLSLLVKLLLEKIELTLSMKSENLKSEKFSLPPMSPRTHKEATDKWNIHTYYVIENEEISQEASYDKIMGLNRYLTAEIKYDSYGSMLQWLKFNQKASRFSRNKSLWPLLWQVKI